MPRLTPGDVFDNPIATEGYVSSDWGLPGEDPDQSYPQDTGYPGEIAGPNYLLEEAQAGVYDEAGSHLFDFTGAYGGGYDSFGADPTVCDPRIQSCPPGTPIPGPTDLPGRGVTWDFASTFANPALLPGYETVVSYAAVPPPTTTLRQGMRGAQVLNWQKYLTSQGFAVSQDSSFGPATARATREFQSSRGLQTDGVVGPATRDAMTQPAVPTSQRHHDSNSFPVLFHTFNPGPLHPAATHRRQRALHHQEHRYRTHWPFGPWNGRCGRVRGERMNLDSLGDMGIVGVCVLLILREVFAYLKTREQADVLVQSGDCDDVVSKILSMEESMVALAGSTSAIQTLIQKTDADGLPLVFTPRSLTAAIEGLGRSVDRLEQKIERIR